MPASSAHHLGVAPTVEGTVLSPGQKAFNALIRKIEKRRARLQAWESVLPAIQKRYVDELLPVQQELIDGQIQLIQGLDIASDRKGLTRGERETLSREIANMAGYLAEATGQEEFKHLYHKHAESDFDKETTEGNQAAKEMLESMLGIDLGDDVDLNSPEEVAQRIQARMAEQEAQRTARHEARQARRSQRKPTARQQAAQARQEAAQAQRGTEQAESLRSLREIHRKLASALHPDREPDPRERERKTQLMQQANEAYDKNDLLKLLELQLELEQVDADAIRKLGEDQLKRYTQLLKEQVAELDQEICQVEDGFKNAYGVPPFAKVSPEEATLRLTQRIMGMLREVASLKSDLRDIDDPKRFKAWLKRMKRGQDDRGFDPFPF